MKTATVREVLCPSWEAFKAQMMRDYAEVSFPATTEEFHSTLPLFRGHARAAWRLSSVWERRISDASGRATRRGALQRILGDFKELAHGAPGVRGSELSETDWWAVGRHYGLVTPLLDWTRSPYVAAFFAFTGFAEGLNPGLVSSGEFDAKPFMRVAANHHVAVWALKVGPYLAKARELEILSPQIDVGHRQRAQRGAFSILTHEQHFDVESYLSEIEFDETPLRKYLIPARETAFALSELRLMNITFGTMFPDLHGAALQANFETAALGLLIVARAAID